MDDLGKSIPAAEAMVDAEQATTAKRANENCLNCGTSLIDVYCHHCGQKDIPRRQTLGDMLTNFISSFWSYEGKFFRTTRYIITSPGFLAVEYNTGRRESYYHPARMYVFLSFVFFLIYFSLPEEKEQIKPDTIDLADLREELRESGVDSLVQLEKLSDSALLAQAPAIQDSLENRVTKGYAFNSKNSTDFESVEKYDSAQKTLEPDERDGWFIRRVKIRSIELSQRFKDKSDEFKAWFGQIFKDNFSKVLFWLLPFFALVLKLLYIRRDFYYSEHLVVTIYYYNFFYLAGSVIMLLNVIPGIGFVGTALSFWVYFYLLFSMKKVYGQKWSKTVAKFAVFSFIFSLFLLVGFSVLVAYIFLFA